MCIYSRISKNFCPPTFQPLHNSVTLFQSTCVHVFLICKSVLYIHTCRCICMKMLVCANVIFSCTVKYEKRGAGGMGKAAKLLASWYQVLGTERGRNRKRQTNPYIYIWVSISLHSRHKAAAAAEVVVAGVWPWGMSRRMAWPVPTCVCVCWREYILSKGLKPPTQFHHITSLSLQFSCFRAN